MLQNRTGRNPLYATHCPPHSAALSRQLRDVVNALVFWPRHLAPRVLEAKQILLCTSKACRLVQHCASKASTFVPAKHAEHASLKDDGAAS